MDILESIDIPISTIKIKALEKYIIDVFGEQKALAKVYNR